jgi:hypothetical protein
MDEKQFDVDEHSSMMSKKQIDKANIKNTTEE